MSRLLLFLIFLQAFFCSMIIASDSKAQNQYEKLDDIIISVELDDVTLEKAFAVISSKTDLNFAYDNNEINGNHRVYASATQRPLSVVLLQISKSADIKFRRINENIFVSSKDLFSKSVTDVVNEVPEQISVSGIVSNSNGNGLPGVNVIVKGTTTGVVSDIDGSFKLDVPDENAILVFSSVGWVSQEVVVGNNSMINVTMTEDTQFLEGVVVVGYGTQKRRNLTGSIASISNDKLKEMPLSNFSEAITGQLPGVQVQQTTGAPGGALNIRVRGTGSLNAGNEPLYVIDGYPISNNAGLVSAEVRNQNINPLTSLNPNDIESIEVLKDASATAIYGSRGSNGVVLITTKRGTPGKPQIQFSTYYGLQEITHHIEMLNGPQWYEYHREAHNNAWIDDGGSASDPNEVRPQGQRVRIIPEDLVETSTNYQEHIYNVAPVQNYQLAVSGGTESMNYYVSAGYFNQEGILNNSGFERFTAKANVSFDLSERIRMGINLTPSYSVHNLASAEGHWAGNAVNQALALAPIFPIQRPDGSYPSLRDFGYGMVQMGNPLEHTIAYSGFLTHQRILSNLNFEVDIVEGLVFRTSFGADNVFSKTDEFRPSVTFNRLNPPRGKYYGTDELNWLNENTLTYSNKFGDHSLSALIGLTYQKESWQTALLEVDGYPNELVQTLNAATNVRDFGTNRGEWGLISQLARVNYIFRDRYLLTASIRRDGSSRFGSDNRWGVFPSVSAGWIITEEEFMSAVTVLSNLKLRASYGLTGNNSIGNYASYGTLNSRNYVFGSGDGNIVNGLAPNSFSNQGLGWETSEQFDVGLDFSFFEDRFQFIVDYYQNETSDLLLDLPIPNTTGFNSALQNIGRVENKGWEFGVTTVNINGALVWSTTANLSMNRNKVLELGPDGEPNISGNWITMVGEPIGSYYGYIQDGIFLNQEDVDNHPHFNNAQPGDVKFRDVNEDGEITSDDRTIIGDNQADFIWGLTNKFTFRNFDLNIIMQGVQGMDVWWSSMGFLLNMEGNQNPVIEALDRWRSPSEPGNGLVPRASSDITGNNNTASTRHVRDASYVRVRNITLGYNINNNVVKFIKSARVYFGIQNALTFTDFFGYNPEVNTNGDNPLRPGRDHGTYPLARTYTLGINLNF